MNTQKNRTETAEKPAKKEYQKPVFNKFGQVAALTTGGSMMQTETMMGQMRP